MDDFHKSCEYGIISSIELATSEIPTMGYRTRVIELIYSIPFSL